MGETAMDVIGSILLNIVSGMICNRADSQLERVMQRRKWERPIANHDLQKAVRKSYLLATLTVCKARCQELRIKFPAHRLGRGRHLCVPNGESGEIVWLDSLGQVIYQELDRLEQPSYSIPVNNTEGQAELESCLYLLVTTTDINNDACLQNIRKSLKYYLLENLKQERGHIPSRFQEMIERGWSVSRNRRQSIDFDWFELLQDFFIEILKTDSRVGNFFEQHLLSQLANDRSIFEDILQEVRRLPLYQEYMGLEVRDRTEALLAEYAIRELGEQEEILEQFDRFIEESSGGILVVTAPPEAGKTTLLTRWVTLRQGRQRFIAYHFFSPYHRTGKISHAYNHLLRQLCVYYELKDETFPETEERLREMFYGLLTRQSVREVEPLIVVLDGLHEAEKEFPSLFEFELPLHLYVIISIRSQGEEIPIAWPTMQSVQRIYFEAPVVTGKRVLISYSESDEATAKNVYRRLREAGHQGFLGGDRVRFREDWQEQLQRCDCLVLLLSENSYADDTIAVEIRKARELQASRQDGKPAIVPVRLGNVLLNTEQRNELERLPSLESTQLPEITSNILAILATENLPELTSETREELVVEERIDRLPSPVAEEELQRIPTGGLSPNSALYIERSPIEEDCFREILQPGALIRIKAARQMGKTSLMSRILAHAKMQGYQVVSLSFQRTEHESFMDLDRLLKWFCRQVGRRLKQLQQLNWDSDDGSKGNCSDYFEDYLLAELDCPLVLGLDEVDRIFPYRSVADDFFGLLRAWYDEARSGNDYIDELWKKFRLVIVHSTEVYIPKNINQSPFNVGMEITLPEFNCQQVLDLSQRYQLGWEEEKVERLMGLVGGHPYLVRRAFYHLWREEISLEELERSPIVGQKIYRNHLQRFWSILQEYPELMEVLREVVMTDEAVKLELTLARRLESMGVVKIEENEVLPRCRLYREYFQDCFHSTSVGN